MDKVDAGMVLRVAMREDLELIAPLVQQTGYAPTHSIDLFKNRRGKFNKVRLWVQLDLGTVRSKELYLTDMYGSLLEMDTIEGKDMSAIVGDMSVMLDYKTEEEVMDEQPPKLQITL